MPIRDQVLGEQVDIKVPLLSLSQRHVMSQSYLVALKSLLEAQIKVVNDCLAIMAVDVDEEPSESEAETAEPIHIETMGQDE